MATVKFLLQSEKNPAAIYCRLASGNLSAKRKTGLYIDPAEWSKAKGLPIQKSGNARAIHQQLVKLGAQLIEDLNEASELSGAWLQRSIDAFFGRVDTTNSLNFIADYSKHFAQNLEYRLNNRGERGAAKQTLVKYRTVANKLAAFDQYKGKRHLFTEMTLNLRAELVRYFVEVEGLSENYTGRLVKFVKTVARDARNNGIEVAPQVDQWQGFTVKAEKIILKPEEIEAIEAQRFTAESMEAAKDWLVISCYTGQRVSDLLRMNSAMIETHEDSGSGQAFSLITLTQQKTGKTVSIPVHEKVQVILNKRGGEFPPTFGQTSASASTIYNRLVKLVAKAAGLVEPTKGRLKDESGEKHTAQGVFPKWQLVSSHIGRRSFASNFYAQKKYPTPLLMEITAHATERQFLEYIGQKPIEKSMALARIWAEEAAARTNKPEGTVKSLVG
jgi:integrase